MMFAFIDDVNAISSVAKSIKLLKYLSFALDNTEFVKITSFTKRNYLGLGSCCCRRQIIQTTTFVDFSQQTIDRLLIYCQHNVEFVTAKYIMHAISSPTSVCEASLGLVKIFYFAPLNPIFR